MSIGHGKSLLDNVQFKMPYDISMCKQPLKNVNGDYNVDLHHKVIAIDKRKAMRIGYPVIKNNKVIGVTDLGDIKKYYTCPAHKIYLY